MLGDFKFLKHEQNEEVENVPVNPRDSLSSQPMMDRVGLLSKPFKIQQKNLNQSRKGQSQIDKTPTQNKHRFSTKARYCWAKSESSESYLPHGGTSNTNLRVSKGIGRETLSFYSESNFH
ncbi:hypothetical protein HRI_003349800 [Hibiscus trionum]|uniref:Uncharacterized protein n=1 Tax=Hibiscus trionum TaxID=183268 RepID=A0A9W7IKU6_HIBTR|nr:hypothetical protein HRI_003349800 [Hibiscus trionum]